MNLNDSFKRNPFLTTVIGNVNPKSNKWSDGNKPTIQASKVDFLTPQFGISQLIKEPTYILKNSSSCTDLFTTQANMTLESGVHHALHQNCHQQIKFTKFTRLPIKGQFFTIPKQFWTIFRKLLFFLIGRTLSLILMLMPKCPFFPGLS